MRLLTLTLNMLTTMPTVREDKQENYTGFDHEVLSKYKGIALHCWSFEQTYNFKQGISFETPLISLTTRPHDENLNHLSDEENFQLFTQLYKILKES